MSTYSFLIALWLASSPPQGESTHGQALADLEAAAQSIAEVPPAEAIARIERSLARVLQHPRELLVDPTAADRIAKSRLALAWAYLAQNDTDAATTVMDEAIRSSAGRDLPLVGLGPDLRQLHDQRRRHLEGAGTGTIAVDCEGCELLVDERSSRNPTGPLLLGSHRVWAFDPHGDLEPMFVEVVLEQAGQTSTFVYRIEPNTAPMPPGKANTAPELRPTPEVQPTPEFQAQAPRWTKILSMALGASLVVTGSVLLALDGSCENGDTPTSDNFDTSCRRVWTNEVPGYSLIGVGGGLFLGASVWLTVDEARSSRSRRTDAMIAWTLRF